MLIEYTLAELAEVLRGRQLLVCVRLHEEGECLARDRISSLAGTNSDAVRGSSKFSGGSQLKGLSSLERQTVRWDGDFGKVATTSADV